MGSLPRPVVRAIVGLAALGGALVSGLGARDGESSAVQQAPVAPAVVQAEIDPLVQALPRIGRRLSAERRVARRSLAAARTGAGQEQAAQRAAAAYERAARSLKDVRSTDARREKGIRALLATAAAYERLGSAARARRPSEGRAAAKAIERREAAVRRVLFSRG